MRNILITAAAVACLSFAAAFGVASAEPQCVGSKDFSTCTQLGFPTTSIQLGDATIDHGQLRSGAIWTTIMIDGAVVKISHFPGDLGTTDTIEIRRGDHCLVHSIRIDAEVERYDCSGNVLRKLR
jgi:hypothetical protein